MDHLIDLLVDAATDGCSREDLVTVLAEHGVRAGSPRWFTGLWQALSSREEVAGRVDAAELDDPRWDVAGLLPALATLVSLDFTVEPARWTIDWPARRTRAAIDQGGPDGSWAWSVWTTGAAPPQPQPDR